MDLVAKLMFQELWKSDIGWDDYVSYDGSTSKALKISTKLHSLVTYGEEIQKNSTNWCCLETPVKLRLVQKSTWSMI